MLKSVISCINQIQKTEIQELKREPLSLSSFWRTKIYECHLYFLNTLFRPSQDQLDSATCGKNFDQVGTEYISTEINFTSANDMQFSQSQKILIFKMVVQIFNSTSLFVIVFLSDKHYLSVFIGDIDHYIQHDRTLTL